MAAECRAPRNAGRASGVALVCSAVLLGITGCSSGEPQAARTRTVTVTPTVTSSPVASSSASVSPTPSTTTAPANGASPTSTTRSRFTGTCETLLPLSYVQDAVGAPVTGATSYVVGKPEPTIHRLAYLNCRYGLSGASNDPKAVPTVEIGLSLYASAADAEQRIGATVDDYTNNGATATPTTVAGHEGQLLTGGVAPDFDVPLLVVASGQRTVAVSVNARLGDEALRSKAITALAELAIRRTGG